MSKTVSNPYPRVGWRRITHFSYETPLKLRRDINSVQTRRGDDADYIVDSEYRISYRLDDGEPRCIKVPKGMPTDLVSAPRIAKLAGIGRVGPYLEASIVHDFLYRAWNYVDNPRDRVPLKKDRYFSDKLHLAGMKAAKVNWLRRQAIHRAVRMFGWWSYRDPYPGDLSID